MTLDMRPPKVTTHRSRTAALEATCMPFHCPYSCGVARRRATTSHSAGLCTVGFLNSKEHSSCPQILLPKPTCHQKSLSYAYVTTGTEQAEKTLKSVGLQSGSQQQLTSHRAGSRSQTHRAATEEEKQWGSEDHSRQAVTAPCHQRVPEVNVKMSASYCAWGKVTCGHQCLPEVTADACAPTSG